MLLHWAGERLIVHQLLQDTDYHFFPNSVPVSDIDSYTHYLPTQFSLTSLPDGSTLCSL